MLTRRATRKRSSRNQLKMGKRGVYFITCRGKLATFRLVTWEQMLAQLEPR